MVEAGDETTLLFGKAIEPGTAEVGSNSLLVGVKDTTVVVPGPAAVGDEALVIDYKGRKTSFVPGGCADVWDIEVPFPEVGIDSTIPLTVKYAYLDTDGTTEIPYIAYVGTDGKIGVMYRAGGVWTNIRSAYTVKTDAPWRIGLDIDFSQNLQGHNPIHIGAILPDGTLRWIRFSWSAGAWVEGGAGINALSNTWDYCAYFYYYGTNMWILVSYDTTGEQVCSLYLNQPIYGTHIVTHADSKMSPGFIPGCILIDPYQIYQGGSLPAGYTYPYYAAPFFSVERGATALTGTFTQGSLDVTCGGDGSQFTGILNWGMPIYNSTSDTEDDAIGINGFTGGTIHLMGRYQGTSGSGTIGRARMYACASWDHENEEWVTMRFYAPQWWSVEYNPIIMSHPYVPDPSSRGRYCVLASREGIAEEGWQNAYFLYYNDAEIDANAPYFCVWGSYLTGPPLIQVEQGTGDSRWYATANSVGWVELCADKTGHPRPQTACSRMGGREIATGTVGQSSEVPQLRGMDLLTLTLGNYMTTLIPDGQGVGMDFDTYSNGDEEAYRGIVAWVMDNKVYLRRFELLGGCLGGACT